MDSEHTPNTPDMTLPGERHSMVYNPGETLYGAVAAACLANGWTLLPQERGERRLTARIDGRALKWGRYIERQPTAKEIEHWSLQAPAANGAIMMGPTSGNVFCFDIDVVDPELSLAIQDCATETLGYTRFSRIGQKPKIALFYRVETEKDLPKNRAYRFVTADGEAVSEHLLEIQAKGKLVTAFGYHHKTEKYFEWEGPQPTTYRTDEVPLVTSAQIDSFIDAVQQIRPFHKSSRAEGRVVLEGDGTLEVTAEGWVIPDVPGAVDADTGLIGEGRKQWLSDFGWEFVRHNPELVDEHPDQAVEVVIAHAVKTLDLHRALDLRELVTKKMERDVGTLRAGGIRSFPKKTVRQDGKVSVARNAVLPGSSDPALSHLPPADKRKAIEFEGKTAPDAALAAARALVLDRAEIGDRVASGVLTAFDQFFAEAHDADREAVWPIHVLKAPTGAGKTTRAIRYIAEDERTYQYDADRALGTEGTPGPILFLLPTYNNIDEVRARAQELGLDPSLSDEALAVEAKEAHGLISTDDVDEVAQGLAVEAGRTSFRTTVYKGKIAAGCNFAERMQTLMDAGISTSGMCKATVRDRLTGERTEQTCIHYATCPAIQQRSQIKLQHVVFLPHAFLSLSIPEELKDAVAVVADERLFSLALHVARMELKTLAVGREPPPLSKAEKKRFANDKEGAEAFRQDLLQDRSAAAEVVVSAFEVGKDPCDVLAEHKDGKLTGADLVASALRVCGAGINRNVAITPNMADTDFANLVRRPSGTEIALEHRFWKIVSERIDALKNKTAKQSREQRLQLQSIVEEKADGEVVTKHLIRLAWRSELNWTGAPLLLLDASANERIVKKVFAGRHVVMHEIEAPENLRCVLIADRSRSTRSLTPVADINSADMIARARHVAQVRAVETALAAVHSNGRMAVGSAKAVRTLIRNEYLPPANVDDLHYGAERGLNFAENHVAALAIGRMELPTWALDAYAAALGYDDDEELLLLDPRGDGTIDGVKPLMPVLLPMTIPMRDGSNVTINVPMAPAGTWQRIVQQQFREESLRQFAGRLRPVYRGDTPTLYLMSQVVPEGMIVDDVVALDDLLPSYAALLEAARLNDGLIDPHRAFRSRPDLATKQAYVDQFLSLPDELKAGYNVVRIGKKSVAVPSHFEDPVAEARRLYPGVEKIILVREAANKRVAPADVRPEDKIEVALGSRDERQNAEVKALERAKEHLRAQHKCDTKNPTYLDGNAVYHVGKDKDGKPVRLPLSAIAMLIPAPKEQEKEAQKPLPVAMPKTGGLGKMGGALKPVEANDTMTDDDWEAAAAI